jgi:HKD family nuclease
MHRLACLFSLLAACAVQDPPEDLGDLGDGKADGAGIVDKSFTVNAGESRTFTFATESSFRVGIAQPATPASKRPAIGMQINDTKIDAAAEPGYVSDDGATGSFTLTVTNTGADLASLVLNVRMLGDFGDMPHPNGSQYPEMAWQPADIATWPSTYVIFNNPGCGKICTQADQNAAAPRSVMIKMLVSAIENVKDGGIVRVSNFNISSSATAKPVVDALLYALQMKHATVRIVMDQGQNVATSETTLLSQMGAEVRFLNGLTYSNTTGGPTVGIMHSKIVAVDDQVVFTGSNNFSGTGFVTNEENSVVLRAPDNSERITSFQCDIDKMFAIGVAAGQPQLTDDARKDALLALDSCNGTDVWFPPTGMTATGKSVTSSTVLSAIYKAKKSVSIAPDMLASPSIVYALIDRAKQAPGFRVHLVLDASEEALGNPAFGDCLAVSADAHGFDFDIRYWRGNQDIFQLMHHKFMIIDEDVPGGAILYNGSANYSARAMSYSFENVTRYDSKQYKPIVDAFTARFAKMRQVSMDKAALTAAGITPPACPLDTSSL